MNKAILKTGIVGLLMLDSISAHGQQMQGTVSGVGVESCATYAIALTENRPTAAIDMGGKTYFTMANSYTQWVMGFVNAANWLDAASKLTNSAGKKVKIQDMSLDVNGVALWVKNYCDANPTKTIYNGATAYVNAHTVILAR